ncbi:PREDICTED: tyrosine-sulfated glycopeptide receptor 1-like [Erythranthe guttata]|uniref:tyrosine-sulfated glycopeptide receptor 1-like n=1 Tax=Erythranthe guttata TaxID=4155 RepID=UPI00064DACEA|nr:PREDICTED: tyrosine-sulfated glycopeptide receptor 1-like [Erythranthe guttata]|eukprot:XP_012830465.1 PREDICTED: tyrosine-sulfated glycopeptide receptor 1-like [Erythranthe guttata]
MDLSYNNLSGSIPKSLEALQHLDYFNVSFNAPRGEIPTGGPFENFTTDAEFQGSIFHFAIIIYRRKNKAVNGTDELVPTVPLERISYYELLQATQNFSETNLLGVWSFGSVYKAVLRDGKIVAVKVFNSLSEASSKSFEVECEVLRNIPTEISPKS